jgi:hypothetical protein
MVVKLTQKQAEFLSTFGDFEDEENKRKALYHITRFGCGYNLTDGDDLKSGAFENSDKLKMVEAVINGYELIESKYKFYNFSDSSGGTPLYYAGLTNELKGNKKFALEVKKDSEEYKALLTLGFIEEEI